MNRIARSALRPLVRCRDSLLYADGLPRCWPVRRRSGVAPFFILGHPRSGTTLLRSILCRHPALFVPPENGALAAMLRVYGARRSGSWPYVVSGVLEAFAAGYEFSHWRLNLDALERAAVAMAPAERSLAALISLIYQSYGAAEAPGKTRWGDKTSSGSFYYLDKLDRVFPDAQYIHLVRDGRDCVASCVRAGFFFKSHVAAALAWRDNVDFCRRFGRRRRVRGRYLEMRYESLVAEPQRQTDRLCDFLSVDRDAALLRSPQRAGRAADLDAIEHHVNVRKPIFTDSVGAWRRQIPAPEQDRIGRILRSQLRACGYRETH